MLFNGKATNALVSRPDCDLCKQAVVPQQTPAAVDGATVQGPWGYLCIRHHRQYGLGLGMGKGQVLLCGDTHDAEYARQYGLKPTTAAERTALAS